MNLKKNLFVLFTFIITINGCAQSQNEISVIDLKEKIKTDSNLIILDVRMPQELESELGKIEGVVNIPIQELEARIHELDEFKDKEIAVICRSGNRSGQAVKILEPLGFNAKNVLGGMIQWNKELEKNE
ncbi:MAG: rhodanese-like domain-containing protein [Bacteroidetes bacterium]|nr:rhodanese-like domain-containing protein [Bacteroidota bacterium]